MKQSLGETLKELRKSRSLTAKDVSTILKDMGYSISDKTLSGYENGIRMPNADVFMALCQIYKCKNILEMFSFVEADYSIPTDEEWIIIEHYRKLNQHGKEIVDFVLSKEYENSISTSEIKEAKVYNMYPEQSNNHLEILAAHERTDIKVTDEMRKHDKDIMMDDSEWE